MLKRKLRNIVILVLATFTLLSAAAGLWAVQAWSGLLQSNDIRELDWHRAELSLDGLQLERVSFERTHPDFPFQASGEELELSWDWQGVVPQLQTIRLERLTLEADAGASVEDVHASDTPGSTDFTDMFMPGEESSRVPPWLPVSVSVKDFTLRLPCRTGQCELNGALAAQRSPDGLPAQANLLLRHDGRMLVLYAEAGRAGLNGVDMALSLGIESETVLQAEAVYQPGTDGEGRAVQGSLRIPELPRVGWLLAWLNQWTEVPVQNLPDQPESANLNAYWSLNAPANGPFLRQASGSFELNGELSQPWPIPELGTLQGQLGFSLKAGDGNWRSETARADLTLTDPGPWILDVPAALRPRSLELTLRPGKPLSGQNAEANLPLAFSARARGDFPVRWDGQLQLVPGTSLDVTLRESRLRAGLPHYQVGEWVARGMSAELSVTGIYQQGGGSVRLESGSVVNVDHLDHAMDPLWLDGIEADVAGVTLIGPKTSAANSYSAKGPYAIRVQGLHHPVLAQQPWSLSGDFRAGARQLESGARLQADSGAIADLQLQWPYAAGAQLDASVQGSGEDVNDILRVFSGWPEAFSVNAGKLQAEARLRLPPARDDSGDRPAPEIVGDLELTDLAGLHDRMAWAGLSGKLAFARQDERLTVQAPDLSLEQLNPGVVFGPIRLAGHYEAQSDGPAAGRLALETARSGVLGGHITVPAMSLSLAERPLRVPLEVEGIDLAQLMTVYPAEGLSGTGTLNGKLPLVFASGGIRVEGGRMSAVDPGGRLQLPAERIRALGQGNQALDMVAGALENFHYSVLDSTIDYRQDGTLHLGLNLHGRNPDLPQSPPVVLNVNLEEDIPALLTSLQLSGRVNEAVTRRVQELMQERQREP